MRGKRVLIAEDSARTRDAVKAALRVRGFVVTAVEDGVLALEAAESSPFDYVISDREMPNMGGVELLVKLLRMSNTRQAVLIIFSGDPEGYEDSLPRGIIHVPKPRLPALLRALGEDPT